ncbi:MAG: ParB/RepB/Spo0J family partition protein [Cellulosilyticaceae bacterium]
MKSKGLGKGLNALLSEETLNNSEESGIKVVNINEVEPNSNQPRKKFSQEELSELCVSIQEHGVLQPLIVREKGNKYQIVAGERRFRAAKMASLKELPIIIKNFSDKQTLEVSLIENIQREDLNIMELANAYSLLMENFDLTQDDVALKVGKSRPSITNIMRLMKLTPYVQQKLRDNQISSGHGKAILSIRDIQTQKKIVDYIIENELSVRETERYIQDLLKPNNATKKKEEVNPFYREIQENLQLVLGTKVTISKTKKKGKIEIEYYSDEELEKIVSKLQKNN